MARLGVFGRALAVTVTTTAALSVAACGNEGSSATSSGSTEAKPAKTYETVALSKDEIMTVAARSAMKAGSAHLTMKMVVNGKLATDMQGDVSYADGGSVMQATISTPQTGKMQTRYVGKILYLQIPGQTPAGKFFAIDPSDPSSPMAKYLTGLSDQMDPLSSVRSMQSSVTSAKRVSAGTVQGVPVDKYEVTVDTAKMIAKLGAAGEAAQSQLPKKLTYDFWLDKDHLIRRMSFDLLGAETEISMSDWGKPVTVQRPAAADIVKPPAAPATPGA